MRIADAPDYHWQSQGGHGFDAANFIVNWETQSVICPEGKTSSSWTPTIDSRGNPVIKIKFAGKDCAVCPSEVA